MTGTHGDIAAWDGETAAEAERDLRAWRVRYLFSGGIPLLLGWSLLGALVLEADSLHGALGTALGVWAVGGVLTAWVVLAERIVLPAVGAACTALWVLPGAVTGVGPLVLVGLAPAGAATLLSFLSSGKRLQRIMRPADRRAGPPDG
ncbi:hypothetical protein [Actinomadura hibisca]|uniref:hypothetical protein n=1 Tax=Actinomadura hibisca TaxID=68565 RepID=UPI00082F3E24|nr:hypothetical protein [Actinomadura hibisca]